MVKSGEIRQSAITTLLAISTNPTAVTMGVSFVLSFFLFFQHKNKDCALALLILAFKCEICVFFLPK